MPRLRMILQDLELIEEQWRTEAKELFELVSKLQEENRRLSKQDFRCAQEPRNDGQNDSKMLHRLQTTVQKQRDEIREKDKIIQDNVNDAEVVSWRWRLQIRTTRVRARVQISD